MSSASGRPDFAAEANRARAASAGHQQAAHARRALAALHTGDGRRGPHRQRWIHALQHRINHPDATLAELGSAMTPSMTKHAYAALLRRALRGGGITKQQHSQRVRRE